MASDLDRLQGVWTISTLELDGQAMPAAALAGATITIRDDRFESRGLGDAYSGTLHLDPRARPKRLDLCFDRGPERGNVNPCIYALDGDSLRLCISTRSGRRPQRFATQPGSGFALETLTRSAPRARAAGAGRATGAKRAPKGPPGGGRPAPAARTEIQGEWRMVTGIVSGVTMDAATMRWVSRTNEGNRTRVLAGTQVMLDAEFVLDPSAEPKAIDYRHVSGPHRGKSQRGIYALEDGTLRILMGAPGGTRPRRFADAPPRGGTLTVWTRS